MTGRKFSGTVTLITGASSGIGAALAREIARQGGDLALAARRKERLAALAEEIRAMGRQALALRCDVTRDGDVEEAAAKLRQTYGRIDYVVANAGFGVLGKVEKLSLEDYRRQFETNVFGVLRTVKATQGDLVASSGCFAIIGSVNGYLAQPGLSAYAMSKFAVHGLADALRHELRPLGVGVVHVVPGFVDSEIRKVDNLGVYHPEARDRIPPKLCMPAQKAASQIADALLKRQDTRVITGLGKVAVFMQRHCPALISFFVPRIGLQTKKS
ncbi:MAG TPA: SDR family NAD(P)-dependent oxidoreductase [Syntrophales bacterium]|nr:SDR family NAD(P)-dependent oxidoreductase [Syntrophales bacterium]